MSPLSPVYPRPHHLPHHQQNGHNLLPRMSVPDVRMATPSNNGGYSAEQSYTARRMSIQMDPMSAVPMNLGGGSPYGNNNNSAPIPVSRPHTFYTVQGSTGPISVDGMNGVRYPPGGSLTVGSSSLPAIQTQFPAAGAYGQPPASGSAGPSTAGHSSAGHSSGGYGSSSLYPYGSGQR